jgi:ABC-type multidrug transport system ATPase subunit
MPALIDVNNLSKTLGDVAAVSDLSFIVNSGEVYGFLGQNGAGKSTTIRMLLTLIKPDSGSIKIFGLDLKHHRIEILRRVGAIIEKPDLYKYLSAFENLRIFGTISGVKHSAKELTKRLEYVGLGERANSKVKTFSQGMKQRLGIAVALINDPELIILDEPTNGLDPQGIADMRNLIISLSRDSKKTVFISSHLLSEMELIADSLLIIDKGKKIVEGRMKELISPDRSTIELVTADNAKTVIFINNSGWKQYLKDISGDKLVFEMRKEIIPDLTRDLVNNYISVLSIRPVHSLENYFLSKTQL